MIAVYLFPLYVLVNLYVFRWGIRYMSACSRHFKKKWIRIFIGIIYTFSALSLGIGFFLKPSMAQRFFKCFGNYWLGVSLYMILVIVIVDLGRFFLKRIRWIPQERLRSRRTFVITGTCCVILIASVSVYGVLHVRHIRTTPYKVTVEKRCAGREELKIALVADIHLGYSIGTWQMREMAKKINAQQPDLVCIAGDIFDNEYEALDDPEELIQIFRSIESTYGVYACYGNHDIQEKILAGFTFDSDQKKMSDERMDKFLEEAGIILLRDEAVCIDDAFYLCGRPDAKVPGRGIEQRKTPKELIEGLDLSKPLIVIDHEPSELQELADAGIDMDLCGHTHNGQMFPGNLIMPFLWENPYGYLNKDGMHNIVTSGIGLFGPNMRVGTDSEIVMIDVNFQPENKQP